jgi:hypothetical protein
LFYIATAETSLFSFSFRFSLMDDWEKNFLEMVNFLGLLGESLASRRESGLGRPL